MKYGMNSKQFECWLRGAIDLACVAALIAEQPEYGKVFFSMIETELDVLLSENPKSQIGNWMLGVLRMHDPSDPGTTLGVIADRIGMSGLPKPLPKSDPEPALELTNEQLERLIENYEKESLGHGQVYPPTMPIYPDGFIPSQPPWVIGSGGPTMCDGGTA